MKHYKRVVVPERTIEQECYTTCDMCHQVIESPGCYEVDEVEIKRRTGSNYPDGGGDGEAFEPDICGKCFDEKVLPWLASQGVDTKSKDWDW